MAYSPEQHHLPAALVAADEPLSADVQRRSWEALQYLWQVTTGTQDAAGASLSSPQGHTHDGVRDQTLPADSSILTGWACGHLSTVLVVSSDLSPDATDPIFTPNGRWTRGAGVGKVEASRGLVEVPYAPPPAAIGSNAQVMLCVLIEHGTSHAAGAITVTATLDGQVRTATNAVVVVGLEVVSVGPWAAASLPNGGGVTDLIVEIESANSAEHARVWSSVLVAS
jgi:hypothetical protein